jgi:hypothetical protein
MAKRRKRDAGQSSPEEMAALAFTFTVCSKLGEVAKIQKSIRRVLAREPDPRFRKRYDGLIIAANRWAVVRIRGELRLAQATDELEKTHLESCLLSIEAGLEDAARAYAFDAEAVRLLSQIFKFESSRADVVVSDDIRQNAAALFDVLKD